MKYKTRVQGLTLSKLSYSLNMHCLYCILHNIVGDNVEAQ